MKKLNYLFVLPMMVIASFALAACSGLTDQEKKFVGEWSSEVYKDTTISEGMELIMTSYGVTTYNEDKTYDDTFSSLTRLEVEYQDATIRMYWYYQGNDKNSWSADNGVYSDSTITFSVHDVVAPYNAIAVRYKDTGEIERFGINNFPKDMDSEVKSFLTELYNEETKAINEIYNENNGKSLYKIISQTENEIIIEDNDGFRDTLKKGNVYSPRVAAMLRDGEALKR